MKQKLLILALAGPVLAAGVAAFHRPQTVRANDRAHSEKAPPAAPQPQQAPPNKIEISLDKASTVALPTIAQDLKPAVFKTEDGKSGWVVRIPGGSSIPTPAFADGMV